MMKDETKGLWFGAHQEKSGNNWFGNVTYKISFEKFENMFLKDGRKYRVFLLEINQYDNTTSTRLLVAPPEDPIVACHELQEYRSEVWGGPWCTDDAGDNWRLAHTRMYRAHEYHSQQNNLEFFLLLSDADVQTLLDHTDIVPANHMHANFLRINRKAGIVDKFYHMCHKYRVGGTWRWCSSGWSASETQELLSMMSTMTDVTDRLALCITLGVLPQLVSIVYKYVAEGKRCGFRDLTNTMMTAVDNWMRNKVHRQEIAKTLNQIKETEEQKEQRRNQEMWSVLIENRVKKEEIEEIPSEGHKNVTIKMEIKEEREDQIKQEGVEPEDARVDFVNRKAAVINGILKEFLTRELKELQTEEISEKDELINLQNEEGHKTYSILKTLATTDRSERVRKRVEKWMLDITKQVICELREFNSVSLENVH